MSRRRNEGVRLASNGSYWLAAWYDTTGQLKRKSLGPKSDLSRAEARRACARLEAEHIARPGSKNAGRAPTLEQWEADYFEVRKGELKDGTETLHRQTFARLRERFGATCRLDRIDKAGAAGFRVWLLTQPDRRRKDSEAKLSVQSVARHIRDCKVIFAKAAELDLIPVNPFSVVKPGSVAVVKTWQQVTLADLDKILAVCPDDRWRVAFALARHAGLRRGECLRLTRADIDLDRSMIHVIPEADEEGVRKEGTKQRERWVPISPSLASILAPVLEGLGPESMVCNIPTENIHRDANVILRRAGVGPYEKPFHTLKKCLASDWLAAGHAVSDVAQWLGDSVEVLMKHYARFLQSSADKVTGKRDEMAELRQRLAQLEAENQTLKGGTA